jgi:biopolymer transport protein ExbB/TolQ
MFMTPITIIGLVMLGLGIFVIAKTFGPNPPARLKAKNSLVLQLGVFAFFMGLLSQAIGLMQAFQAIQAAGDVSPALVAGGLYVSFIAPVWGLILLLIGLACYMVAKYRLTD